MLDTDIPFAAATLPEGRRVDQPARRRISATGWKEAGQIFLFSRLILLLVTFLGPGVFPHFVVVYHMVDHHQKPMRVVAPPVQCAVEVQHCLLAWDTWDVGVFVAIAHQGYPDLAAKQNLTAFFPLWPLVLHIVGDHFNNPLVALFYVGLILANLCFYCALVVLYLLIRPHFSARVARDTLLFLAVGPYALFFFIGYSESLFLLLCVGTFFFLQRGRRFDWWLAGLCGFLAALTRSLGLVLMLPFLITVIRRYWPERRLLRIRWCAMLNATLPMLLVPLGLLFYMLYLGVTHGNMLAFDAAQVSWGRVLALPWVGIVNVLVSFVSYRVNFTENFMDLAFTLIPLVGLLVCWRRMPLEYSVFALAMMLFSLTHPIGGIQYPLSSSPRFMLVIFPNALMLALWAKKPRTRGFLLGLSIALFTMNALLFVCNGWVA